MTHLMQFSLGLTVAIALNLAIQTSGENDARTAYSVNATGMSDKAADPAPVAQRANDGLFYVRGTGGAGSVTFLVDTGASHVVLGHKDIDKLKIAPLQTFDRDYLKTASGKVQVKWVVIDELSVGGSTLHNVRAAIPQSDIGISLLGQNALAQFQTVNIDGDTISFKRD